MKEQLSRIRPPSPTPILSGMGDPTHEISAPEPPIEWSALHLCLDRVLASAEFARSERLRTLLIYLLQALELSTSSRVNERNIGIDVFGRDGDWDPALDPCVRVAMGRLRNKLESYYQSAGRTDAIRIILNKASYLPQLVRTTPPIESAEAVSTGGAKDSAVPAILGNKGNVYKYLILGICSLIVIVVWGLSSGRDWTGKKASTFYIYPFSTDLGAQFSPAISPNGRSIAYVWDENDGNFNIYIRPVDGGPAVKLSNGTGDDFYPAWSPDGTRLAFLRVSGWQSKLLVRSMSDGTEKIVATITTARGQWTEDSGPLLGNPGPVWSADGQELIVFDQDHFGIYAISTATGERRQLTSTTQTSRDFYPRLSPDGKSLAFVRYVSHGVSDLYLLPMQLGAEPKMLTHDQKAIRGITWAADGKSLVMASNRTGQYELWRIDTQNATLEAIPSDTSQAANPAMSPDGTWMAFDDAHESTNIEETSISGTDHILQLHPIVATSGRNRDASLSVDGTKLAFFSDRSGSWQIWLSAPDGSEPRQLTHLNDTFAGMVSWAPDGKHIAYDARPGNQASIFLLDVETGQSHLLSTTSSEERAPTWSPDGKVLYFNSDRDGAVSLYRMDMTSGNIYLVANDGFTARITQDGQWLYYVTMHGVLWRSKPDGSAAIEVPQGLQPYSFESWTVSKNDLLILKKSTEKSSFELWRSDSAFHSGRLGWFDLMPHSDVLSIGASPDSHMLLVGTRDQMTSDIVLRSTYKR
jgi:Tol biopolymer transport system component